jgi:hypothetical protein
MPHSRNVENAYLKAENTRLKAELALEKSRNAVQGPPNSDLLDARSNEARQRSSDDSMLGALKEQYIMSVSTKHFAIWILRVSDLNAEFNADLVKTLRQKNHDLKVNRSTAIKARTSTLNLEVSTLKLEVSKLKLEVANLSGFTSI